MHTRKNVRRLFSIWIAIILFFVTLVSPYQILTVQADTYSGYFKYVTLGDDTIKITGLSETGIQAVKSEESIYIPSKLDGKPVVAIGEQALGYEDLIGYLKSVIISQGITSIGHSAFHGMSNLTYITLPDSISYLGDGCFANTNVSSVVVPGSVKKGADGAFDGCQNLKSIILEDGMEEIGSMMFRYASSLTSIQWPENSLKRIDSKAFAYCTSLQEVVLPSTLTELGSEAFLGCTALKKLTLSANLETIGEDAIPDQEDLKIVVPEELTDISRFGLENLGNTAIYVAENSAAEFYLKQCNINNYYTYPSESSDATKEPEETKIPESTTRPEETKAPENTIQPEETKAPENTTQPEETKAPENTIQPEETKAPENTITPGNTGQPEETKGPVITNQPIPTAIPGGRQSAETSASAQTSSSKTVITKGTIFSVNHQKYQVLTGKTVSFLGCSSRNVKQVTIPSAVQWNGKRYTVTAIAKKACKGYSKLKKVTVGKNVKSVGNAAFMNCKKLRQILYGKSVTTIGKNGLRGDASLKLVTIKSKKLKSVGKAAFRKVPAALIVKVPKKQIKSYKILIQKAK